jgi:two-component system KDP operon response regulator KdpE
LLVDDEPDLRDAVRLYLEMHGYGVLQAADGTEAVRVVRATPPDLVVLDVMMPRLDGLAALQELRAFSTVPVIMLTVKGEEEDKVQALRLGADDYVTKPFGQRELLARIESVLRRAAQPPPRATDAHVVDDDLTIDFARNRVILRGAEQPLTATEHRLLHALVTAAGRLVSTDDLLRRVWGPEYVGEDHYVRLYVRYLRAKIEPDPAHPRYILTEKGLGYRFTDHPSRGESSAHGR